jgi:cytochrome c biogenesis factor
LENEKEVVVQLNLDMGISFFFARFYGSLFIILGLQFVFANLLGRTIKMTEDKAITVSTGYITFLLGLITVILHNFWVSDWRVAITILGWSTLIKGGMKIGFPEHVNKQAQMFKAQQKLWGFIIVLMGVWFFWVSF